MSPNSAFFLFTSTSKVEAIESVKRPVILALASGSLLAITFPGTVGWWFLAWFALVPLLLALQRTTPGRAALLGMLAGLLHYLVLLYWIVIVLGRYGRLPWWVAVPALLLLALYMSCYTALFSGITSWAMGQGGPGALWLAPFLWVVLDWCRGWLFSGFPWQDLAYSQYRMTPLIQLADLAGHHGLTFIIVLTNCVVATLLTSTGRRRVPMAAPTGHHRLGHGRTPAMVLVLPATLLILAALTYSLIRYVQVDRLIDGASTLRVGVVQGNIPQDLKWTSAMRQETLRRYDHLSGLIQQQAPDVVVWPETALPFYPANNPLFAELMDNTVRRRNLWLLTGAPHFEREPAKPGIRELPQIRYYNSAFMLAPAGVIAGRYDKQHLVPFGEYIPLRQLLPLPGPLVESLGDFTPGSTTVPLACNNAKVGVLICFESIFPTLARRYVANGATLLANITNDGWFDRSSAPWQHLSMAVFRAVETRRSLARSANTGVSALIDPTGRLLQQSPLFVEATLIDDLPLLTERTLFVRGGYHFPIFCLLVVLLLCGGLRYRQQTENRYDRIDGRLT